MDKFWNIMRFFIIPLLSVAATALFLTYGVSWYWLIPIWIAAFAAVCENGCSAASYVRLGAWVGVHLTVFVLFYFR